MKEETASGCFQTLNSVLDMAEAPAGPGLHFMDSSSAAAEFVTLMGGSC